jgi:hypothetical protein
MFSEMAPKSGAPNAALYICKAATVVNRHKASKAGYHCQIATSLNVPTTELPA